MHIMYIIYIYIYRHSLWCTLEFMGITEIQGMKRWQKKKNALCIKTKLFTLLWLKKNRERDYTLTTGLYSPFEM